MKDIIYSITLGLILLFYEGYHIIFHDFVVNIFYEYHIIYPDFGVNIDLYKGYHIIFHDLRTHIDIR